MAPPSAPEGLYESTRWLYTSYPVLIFILCAFSGLLYIEWNSRQHRWLFGRFLPPLAGAVLLGSCPTIFLGPYYDVEVAHTA